MKTSTLFPILLLVFLSGCATSQRQIDREIGTDQPEEFRQGYGEGCNSGYVAAGHPYYRFSKDVKRYSADDLYRQGWDNGFAICKGKYDSIGNAMRR